MTLWSRVPFLETPGNFSGPKSNIQIEIKRIRARVLARKVLHFFSLTGSFIMLRCKTIKTSILHVNNDGFTSPLIIATLEKRAPRPFSLRDLALLTNYPSHSTRLRHTAVTFTFDHSAVSALPLSQDFTACNMVFCVQSER